MSHDPMGLNSLYQGWGVFSLVTAYAISGENKSYLPSTELQWPTLKNGDVQIHKLSKNKVLTVITMNINIFWIVTSCSVVLEEPAASVFRRKSTLKMEAASSYETLVNFYETTLHHTSEDKNFQLINFLAKVQFHPLPVMTSSQFYPLPALIRLFLYNEPKCYFSIYCIPNGCLPIWWVFGHSEFNKNVIQYYP
jgi:hypothetical protein